MDGGMFLGLLVVEGVPFLAIYYVQVGGGGGSICLHCCSLTYGEYGTDTS